MGIKQILIFALFLGGIIIGMDLPNWLYTVLMIVGSCGLGSYALVNLSTVKTPLLAFAILVQWGLGFLLYQGANEDSPPRERIVEAPAAAAVPTTNDGDDLPECVPHQLESGCNYTICFQPSIETIGSQLSTLQATEAKLAEIDLLFFQLQFSAEGALSAIQLDEAFPPDVERILVDRLQQTIQATLQSASANCEDSEYRMNMVVSL